MNLDLGQLCGKLVPDPFRTKVGFTDEVEAANQKLFSAKDDDTAETILNYWLSVHQPCLFGRMAAKTCLISHCILRHDDLIGDEKLLQEKIQSARRKWTRKGFVGKKSAFVITVVSRNIAYATPDDTVMSIASKLCGHYLLRQIVPGEVYHDEMFLEKPGTKRAVWKWLAGVNYFSAQGDKRWWQDHRIPGGMAFSINSVGHLVKSGQMSEALKILDEKMGGPVESNENERVTTPDKALDLAMRTINLASVSISGRATQLLDLDKAESDLPACPIQLPKAIAGKDHTKYRGWYHTDVTVPPEYFRPNVERPPEQQSIDLDFTYLFHDDVENPDHIVMGKGRRVRAGEEQVEDDRLRRMVARSVAKQDHSLLTAALEESD